MKNVSFKAGTVLLAVLCLMAGQELFAGSVDYLSNRSANNVMTMTTNADIDSADAVAYNPAGTSFLPKGFSVDLSNQFLLTPYTNEIGVKMPAGAEAFNTNREVDQDHTILLLPNLYMVYNFGKLGAGNLAIYGEVGAVAGGGSLIWKSGTAGTNAALIKIVTGIIASGGPNLGTISSQKFKGESAYYTAGLGASYSFLNDMLSVGLGGRVVMPNRSFTLEAAFISGDSLCAKFDYDALGFTPVIGLDIRPLKGLTVGLRYEMETDLEFKYKQKKKSVTGTNKAFLEAAADLLLRAAGIEDGAKFNYNLPHVIGMGVGYDINDKLNVMASSSIYLLSSADMNGEEDFYGTGWEVSLGCTYMLLDNLKVGCGVMYSEVGAKKSYFNSTSLMLNASTNPPLDYISFGIGETYSFAFGLDLTVSCMYVHYFTEKYDVTDSGARFYGEYTKDILALAVGVDYHI